MNSEYYDHKVKKWDDMLRYSPAPRARRRLILKLIRRYAKGGDSLHDIGCANGLLLKTIRNNVKNVTLSGSDISKETVELNKKNYPDIEFYHLDIGAETSHRHQYEIITCAEVLEHVPDVNIAIRNIASMLLPGGKAILTLPMGKIYPIDKEAGHIRHFENSTIFNEYFSVTDEMHWGFPFFNLYKSLINVKPEIINEKFGERKYGPFNKLVSHLIYMLFRCNLPFGGKQLVLVLQKK